MLHQVYMTIGEAPLTTRSLLSGGFDRFTVIMLHCEVTSSYGWSEDTFRDLYLNGYEGHYLMYLVGYSNDVKILPKRQRPVLSRPLDIGPPELRLLALAVIRHGYPGGTRLTCTTIAMHLSLRGRGDG